MFNERLKLARKKAGFSLRVLAEKLDKKVSAQAIGKYERGEMMPSSDVLSLMASTLNVSLEYLLSNQVHELQGVDFRKNSRTSVKERSIVEANVIEMVQKYLSIEEVLDLNSAEWHEPFPPKKLTHLSEAEDLANDLRNSWQLGNNPIPNMTELLEEKGIKILIIDLPNKVSGLTCTVIRGGDQTGVPVIVVNKNMPLERRRFTLCHELAHRLINDDSQIDHEKASDRFAGSFLVTKQHLIKEIGEHRKSVSIPELYDLKGIYRVSAAAMLMRCKQANILSSSAVTYAFQTYGKSWRTEEPQPLESKNSKEPQENAKRFRRLCFWALSENLISPIRATELLEEPYHEIEKELKGIIN